MQFVRSLAVGTLIGRLGGPPEAIGKTGVQISIAAKELLPAEEGTDGKGREDTTHWFKVALWGEARADWAMRELASGDLVSCNVQMSTRQYKPDGAKKPVWLTNFAVPPWGEFILLARNDKPPAESGRGQDRNQQGRDRGREGNQGRRVEYDNPRDEPGRDPRDYDHSGRDMDGPPPRDLPPPEPAQQRRGRGTPARGDNRRGGR